MFADETDELFRILKSIAGTVEACHVLGRIATQRKDVFDRRFGIPVEDRADLFEVVTNTGQVRDSRQHRLTLNPHHQVVGALAGRSARAIGHRHKRRLERLKMGDRGEELVRRLIGLGREELEAERGCASFEYVLDMHGHR